MDTLPLAVADFQREYGIGFREVMELPARLFYLYLDGLSLKSRWMQAQIADYEQRPQQETGGSPYKARQPKSRVITDKTKARELLGF